MGIDSFDFLGKVIPMIYRKELHLKISLMKDLTIWGLEEKQFILLDVWVVICRLKVSAWKTDTAENSMLLLQPMNKPSNNAFATANSTFNWQIERVHATQAQR